MESGGLTATFEVVNGRSSKP